MSTRHIWLGGTTASLVFVQSNDKHMLFSSVSSIHPTITTTHGAGHSLTGCARVEWGSLQEIRQLSLGCYRGIKDTGEPSQCLGPTIPMAKWSGLVTLLMPTNGITVSSLTPYLFCLWCHLSSCVDWSHMFGKTTASLVLVQSTDKHVFF